MTGKKVSNQFINNNLSKIIIYEKCFNIPKITFLICDKIKIECPKCETSTIENISYFDKFMVSKEDKNLFKLEKCNFNEEHKCDAFKYCINCAKFLCDECLKIHYIPFK